MQSVYKIYHWTFKCAFDYKGCLKNSKLLLNNKITQMWLTQMDKVVNLVVRCDVKKNHSSLHRKQEESIKAKQVQKFSYLNPNKSVPPTKDQVKLTKITLSHVLMNYLSLVWIFLQRLLYNPCWFESHHCSIILSIIFFGALVNGRFYFVGKAAY